MCSLWTVWPHNVSPRVWKRKIKGWNSKCQSIPVIFNKPPTGKKLTKDSLYEHATTFNIEWWISDLLSGPVTKTSPPSSSFLSELLSFSLRLFSRSCDSLKAVNNSYLPGEISLYWLLVWWLSRPQANILQECKRFTFNLTGMWSSYLGRRWRFQPVCQVWTAASSQHTEHYLLSLFQCY